MMSSILGLLGSVFSIWEHKEKNKYRDKYMKLEKEYYEESKKDQIDHSRLDNIEFELLQLADSISAQIKG